MNDGSDSGGHAGQVAPAVFGRELRGAAGCCRRQGTAKLKARNPQYASLSGHLHACLLLIRQGRTYGKHSAPR